MNDYRCTKIEFNLVADHWLFVEAVRENDSKVNDCLIGLTKDWYDLLPNRQQDTWG